MKRKENKQKQKQLIRSRLLISPYSFSPVSIVFFQYERRVPEPMRFLLSLMILKWEYTRHSCMHRGSSWNCWYNRGRFDSIIIQFNVTAFVNKFWRLTSIFRSKSAQFEKRVLRFFLSMFLLLHSPTMEKIKFHILKRLQIQ